MKEMPKWNELFEASLEFYKDETPYINREAKVQIANKLNLPEILRWETTPKHKENKIEGRVGFALSHLKIAGLLKQHSRGSFIITDLGKKLLGNKPAIFDQNFLINNYPKYKSYIESDKERQKRRITDKKSNSEYSIINDYTPTEMIDHANKQLNKSLSLELLDKLYSVDPFRFEYIVAELLEKMGYGELTVTKKSGDGGIDAIVNEDKLGLDKILIQAKRYKAENIINEKTVRDFLGALAAEQVQKGIIVTTSMFSDKAKTTARQSDKKIVLIDGSKLAFLLIEYNIGVNLEKTIFIKNIDTDYFNE